MGREVPSGERPAWPWPDSLDALIAAPQYHKLLFENERVRVLEVRIGPGTFVPVHTHRWPSVIQTLRPGEFIRRDAEGKVLFDSRTAAKLPELAWTPPLTPHSIENVGETEILLFTVEVKD